jgi:hypothetical protein
MSPIDPTWITAAVRPAGSFGRQEVGRLQALLGALSACASLVVLDLSAARLRSPSAAAAIDSAAAVLERHGGVLLCVHADDESRTCLGACTHAVVVGADEPVPVG